MITFDSLFHQTRLDSTCMVDGTTIVGNHFTKDTWTLALIRPYFYMVGPDFYLVRTSYLKEN